MLPVLLLGAVACGSDQSGPNDQPEPSAPDSPSANTTNSGSEEGNTPSAAETPVAAVETWVTYILEERYSEACQSTAVVAPPKPDIAAFCASPEGQIGYTNLHTAWAKPGITLPPQSKVTAADATVHGDSATVPDTLISVDGHTLKSLMLIGSTGEGVSSFSITLTVQRQEKGWYVDGFELSNMPATTEPS